MFTGIIEELGEVVRWESSADAARLTVLGPVAVSDAKHGDSISVSGVCLTVVEQGSDWFTADVMAETIAMSTLSNLQPGTRVNLERAAKVGDRIGGHIVQGHIDGTSRILSIEDGSAWRVVRFTVDPEHAPLVTRKGSIAIDGISLTVSAVGEDWFEVSLIPETLDATTLGAKVVGDAVNIETDILARQVERLAHFGPSTLRPSPGSGTGSTVPSTSSGTDSTVPEPACPEEVAQRPSRRVEGQASSISENGRSES